MSRHIRYPYEILRAGDMVCVDARGIFPVLTRIVTGGGIRHALDHSVSTHTGMLVQMGGQLFVQEMDRSGVAINSLEVRYQRWDYRVICFRRMIGIDEDKRALIERRLGEIYRRGVEYDFRGILSYIASRVRECPNRYYCSEMVYAVTRDMVVYSDDVAYRPSPQALMMCQQWETIWHRDWPPDQRKHA